ncbi:MAG: von Willebrand factor type A domain-containing protein, partial [Acidobacteriota bacterium]
MNRRNDRATAADQQKKTAPVLEGLMHIDVDGTPPPGLLDEVVAQIPPAITGPVLGAKTRNRRFAGGRTLRFVALAATLIVAAGLAHLAGRSGAPPAPFAAEPSVIALTVIPERTAQAPQGPASATPAPGDEVSGGPGPEAPEVAAPVTAQRAVQVLAAPPIPVEAAPSPGPTSATAPITVGRTASGASAGGFALPNAFTVELGEAQAFEIRQRAAPDLADSAWVTRESSQVPGPAGSLASYGVANLPNAPAPTSGPLAPFRLYVEPFQPPLHRAEDRGTFVERLETNPFVDTEDDPRSTFGLDVDTASYAMVRSYLRAGTLPPPGLVRVEEMVNAMGSDVPAPEDGDFTIRVDGAPTPFAGGGE